MFAPFRFRDGVELVVAGPGDVVMTPAIRNFAEQAQRISTPSLYRTALLTRADRQPKINIFVRTFLLDYKSYFTLSEATI